MKGLKIKWFLRERKEIDQGVGHNDHKRVTYRLSSAVVTLQRGDDDTSLFPFFKRFQHF